MAQDAILRARRSNIIIQPLSTLLSSLVKAAGRCCCFRDVSPPRWARLPTENVLVQSTHPPKKREQRSSKRGSRFYFPAAERRISVSSNPLTSHSICARFVSPLFLFFPFCCSKIFAWQRRELNLCIFFHRSQVRLFINIVSGKCNYKNDDSCNNYPSCCY